MDHLEQAKLKWEKMKHLQLLLSHHPVDQKDHIINVSFCKHSIPFCARCSGILAGFILSYSLVTYAIPPILSNNTLAIAFATSFSLIFLVNWSIPHVSGKKITRFSRFWSGLLCGIGLSIVLITKIPVLRMLVTGGVVYILAVKTVIMFRYSRRNQRC